MSARPPVQTKLERPSRANDPVATSKAQIVHDTYVSTPRDTQHVPDLPRFGRFRAVDQLGAGAMGTVYRANDDVLGRPVAIKALHLRGDTSVRERFLREARAIGAVLHPNILSIYDVGSDEETPYLVMELATGGSLRERMKTGPLPVEAVRKLGIQIAHALGAAHAAGILHRDVKPANILSGHGDVWKLADFGIARLPDSTLTMAGEFLGSPSYAAPESLRAGQFSPASDVYGLGATLYEALTGVPPHGDHDMRSVIRKLEQEPTPIHARCAVPGPLGDAIMAALSRDPARRPSAVDLASALASDEPGVRPLVRSAPWSRFRKLVVAGIAAAAALAATAFLVSDRSEPASGLPSAQSPTAEETGESGESLAQPGGTRAEDPYSHSESDSDAEQTGHRPVVVDQHGNPVDEETARRILEEYEREARTQYEWIGRGRGRWKR